MKFLTIFFIPDIHNKMRFSNSRPSAEDGFDNRGGRFTIQV